MELAKNIFFNTDKLIETTIVKLSYTGWLCEKDNQDVYIHFGYGENWDNVNDIKMEKTDLGYQAELALPKTDLLNCCFKNGNNEWDNNNGQNFTFPIEKLELSLTVVNDKPYSFIVPHRRLRKSYLLSKKIRLAVYKAITFLPKAINGNVNSIN